MEGAIGIVGLGKLGAPLAGVFALAGTRVVGHDVDGKKVRTINDHRLPTDEPGLEGFCRLAPALTATTDVAAFVTQTSAAIFVTPTPSNPDGSFDHGILTRAVESVAMEVERQRKPGYLFIVTSTTMPGFVGGELRSRIVALMALPFRLAYKPEMIALGSVVQNLRHPDVTLIGADDEATADQVEALYRRILTASTIHRMTITEAELAKISLNCAVTMKISFANQVGMLARRIGADAGKVLTAVGADGRIGSQCLRAGLPFGGPCFPRDNRMFAHVAESAGMDALIARATDRINNQAVLELLDEILLGGPKTVGILGMAYKPGTSVTEESAGAKIAGALTHRFGIASRWHDPGVLGALGTTIEDVMGCEVVVIACPHPEYADLEFSPETRVIDPSGILKLRAAGRAAEVVTK